MEKRRRFQYVVRMRETVRRRYKRREREREGGGGREGDTSAETERE